MHDDPEKFEIILLSGKLQQSGKQCNSKNWRKLLLNLLPVFFGAIIGAALVLFGLEFNLGKASVTLIGISSTVAGGLLGAAAITALVRLVRQIFGTEFLSGLNAIFKLVHLSLLSPSSSREERIIQRKINAAAKKAKPLIEMASLALLTGFFLAIASAVISFASFLITHLQTQRISEQNSLVSANLNTSLITQENSEVFRFAESQYAELSNTLLSTDSSPALQAAALLQLSDLAATAIPRVQLRQIDATGSTSNISEKRKYYYPYAPRVKGLIRAFARFSRPNSLHAKSSAGETLREFEPVSTALLVALHRMGPPSSLKGLEIEIPIPEKAGTTINRPLCLWNYSAPLNRENDREDRDLVPRDDPFTVNRLGDPDSYDYEYKIGIHDTNYALDLRHLTEADLDGLQIPYALNPAPDRGSYELDNPIASPRAQLTEKLNVIFPPGITLNGVNFEGANFFRSSLLNVHFINSNLINTNFRKSNLGYLSMSTCDATGANFSESNLYNFSVTASQLDFANFNSADLRKFAARKNCSAKQAQFVGAIMLTASLRATDISLFGSNFDNADLRGSSMNGRLQDVFEKFHIRGEFHGSSFIGSKILGVNFDFCDFDAISVIPQDFRWTKDARGNAIEKTELIPGSLFRNIDLASSRFYKIQYGRLREIFDHPELESRFHSSILNTRRDELQHHFGDVVVTESCRSQLLELSQYSSVEAFKEEDFTLVELSLPTFWCSNFGSESGSAFVDEEFRNILETIFREQSEADFPDTYAIESVQALESLSPNLWAIEASTHLLDEREFWNRQPPGP